MQPCWPLVHGRDIGTPSEVACALNLEATAVPYLHLPWLRVALEVGGQHGFKLVFGQDRPARWVVESDVEPILLVSSHLAPQLCAALDEPCLLPLVQPCLNIN